MLRTLIALLVATPAWAGTLTVRTEGHDNDLGTTMIAVFDSAEQFRSRDAAVAGGPATIQAGVSQWTVDLPPGTYMIAVYHDENGNGELDSNFLGIPREAWGFSNDAKGTLGPPSFDDAAVAVADAPVTTTIHLR